MSSANTAPVGKRRLFIICVAVAAVLVCTALTFFFWKRPQTAHNAFEVIKAQRGQDLAKLDETEREPLLRAITTLVPERTYASFLDFRPWYIWDFQRKDRPIEHMLFEAHSGPHPGTTHVRITIFDESGKTISESTFGIGHRCYLRGATLEDAIKGEYPVIVMETGRGLGPGPNVHKQYYAKIERRFDLIRLEDSDGKATRNRYYVNHFACGPEVVRQSVAEWEADLLSADRLRVLRALVWLGGTHRDIKPEDKDDVQHEKIAYVQLVRSVRARERVIARLNELAKDKDRWLREAAELALAPEHYRWQ